MRRINLVGMIVILAIIVGCQKNEESLNIQNSLNKTFYATFENSADTRTALDGSNNVIWSENDQISIFGGTTANTSFILQEGANRTYGTFKINTSAAGTESSTPASKLSANVAYYPYESNVTVSEDNGTYTFNATFPTTQTYSKSGTFGIGASPMVAVTSCTLDANLKFKNVGAIFRLQLKGDKMITKVIFSAGADLAGDCQITASYTDVPTVSVTEGSNSIILDCGEGVQLSNDEPTNFIVAMLPVKIEDGGMTITIYDNEGKKMVYTHKADETITIERSKAYTTAVVNYNGDQVANTKSNVQDALAAATPGTTIQLEPGVAYGTIVLGKNAADGRTVDITDIGGDAAGNEYYSKFENITIIGAPGATVDQITFQTGRLETTIWNYIDVKNLTIKDITFTGEKTAVWISENAIAIDGLTISNCKMNDANSNDKFVYQPLTGNKELKDKTTNESVMTQGVKNLKIDGCEVAGAYQVIEGRQMENITITNNKFKNIKARDILLAKYGEATYSGTITITDNTSDGSTERFVRMAGAGDADIEITDNVITNYKGKDVDYIKVEGLTTGSLNIGNNSCTYIVSTVDALENILDAATPGTTIQLEPGVAYGTLVFRAVPGASHTTLEDIADAWAYNYTRNIEKVTIIGAAGATVDAIKFETGALPGDQNNRVAIKDLVIDGVTFTDNLSVSAAGYNAPIMITTSNATVDGLTVQNCKLVGNNEKLNLVYLYGADGSKNIKLDGNTVDGIARLCELRGTENVTITKNIIKNTYEHGMLLTGSGYSGNVTITGNKADGINDRFVRMAGAGNATIVITDNVITNYKGEDVDYIKVTDHTGSLTKENNSCTRPNGDTL